MKYIIVLILLIPVLAFGQVTSQTDVISSGGGQVSNSTYTSFGTFGQPFASESSSSSYTNQEGFLNAQNRLAVLAYVSDSYNTGSPYWGYNHFNNVDDLLLDCSPDAVVHVSGYNHTGNVDMTGHTFIIDSQDFVLHGNLTGGLIRAIDSGYLILDAVQDSASTFPMTDGSADLTVSITSLNPPSNPIKVRIDTGVTGTNFIASTFWDIVGDSNLNATLSFNISKTALSGELGLIRFWNGSRYVPIPQDRTQIDDLSTYYRVTITGINQF